MRLIDAEWLEDLLLMHEQNARAIEASGRKVSFTYADGIRTGYADVGLCPTIEAVPLEDYRSMEQTVYKLTQALAEAEPIKHGRWLNEELFDRGIYFNTQGDCSVCGYHGMATNYCPNCGAKMDEVEE